MAAAVGISNAASRFITSWPNSTSLRMSSGDAFSLIAFMSAPAMKIERLALASTRPLIRESFAMESISSPSSASVRRSKIFAEEPGRSNVRMQTPSSRTCLRMVRCATEFGDVLLGGGAARPEPLVSSFGDNVEIISIEGLVSFQPQRGALAASDAKSDQRSLGFAPVQFFQTRKNQACSSGADRMPKRDSAAVNVQPFAWNLTDRLSQRFASALAGFGALDDRQSLGGESFVDFNQVRIGGTQTGLRFSLCHREDRTKAHASRIAAGVSVSRKRAKRFEAKALGFLPGHDEKCARAVSRLRRIARRDRSSSAVKNRSKFGERFTGLIFTRPVVFGCGGPFGGKKSRANFFAEFFSCREGALV